MTTYVTSDSQSRLRNQSIRPRGLARHAKNGVGTCAARGSRRALGEGAILSDGECNDGVLGFVGDHVDGFVRLVSRVAAGWVRRGLKSQWREG